MSPYTMTNDDEAEMQGYKQKPVGYAPAQQGYSREFSTPNDV